MREIQGVGRVMRKTYSSYVDRITGDPERGSFPFLEVLTWGVFAQYDTHAHPETPLQNTN